MSDTNTGGGASIGGDVHARGVTGRDSANVHVDVNPAAGNEWDEADSALLYRIAEGLLGNPYRPSNQGLLQEFRDLSNVISSLVERQGALEAEFQKMRQHVDSRMRLYIGAGAGAYVLALLYIYFGG